MDETSQVLTGQHAMLLYNDDANPDDTMIRYVNDALKEGHLVVYMPIDENYASDRSRVASAITNYEENVNRGNLCTLQTRRFYEDAIAGNLDLFEELKEVLEEMMRERIEVGKDNKMTLHFGCAGDLTQNDKFEDAITIEKFWQKTFSEWIEKGLNITLLCPHSNSKLNHPHHDYKKRMRALHTVMQETP